MLRLRKRGKNIYEGLYLFELGDCEKLTERIADTWEREREVAETWKREREVAAFAGTRLNRMP